MQSAFRAIVSGRVQLVMYRDFACRKAKPLNVSGTVKNLKDGTVEVVAEGEESALKAFLDFLHAGPMLAQVEDVSVEWGKPTGAFRGFSIIY
jgi:acylphosphatase